jgi:hypothetical protein
LIATADDVRTAIAIFAEAVEAATAHPSEVAGEAAAAGALHDGEVAG